jgi:hypothetical protein
MQEINLQNGGFQIGGIQGSIWMSLGKLPYLDVLRGRATSFRCLQMSGYIWKEGCHLDVSR